MDVIKFIRPRKGVLLSLEGAWGRLPPQLRHCRKSLPGAAASLMLCNPSNSQSVVSWLSSNIHRTWKKCKFLDHMPVPYWLKNSGGGDQQCLLQKSCRRPWRSLVWSHRAIYSLVPKSLCPLSTTTTPEAVWEYLGQQTQFLLGKRFRNSYEFLLRPRCYRAA